MPAPKKVFLTGATGFIGSHLVERLLEQGCEISALMRNPPADVPAGIRVIRGDLSDSKSLEQGLVQLGTLDVVYHLAGVVAASTREGYFSANQKGTQNLMQALVALQEKPKRIVLVSSLAAGGPALDRDNPRLEGDKPVPVSAYGQSKLAAEEAALAFKDRLSIAIVRPPMVYGPRDKGVYVLIKTVSRRIHPRLPGSDPSGEKFYSLIHSDDLVEAILKLGSAAIQSGEIFYVSDGGVYSSSELLQAMAGALGVRPVKLPVPGWVLKSAAWSLTRLSQATGKAFALNQDKLGEIFPDYWICSPEKSRQVLGFEPRVSLAEGMRSTVKWYRDNRWL